MNEKLEDEAGATLGMAHEVIAKARILKAQIRKRTVLPGEAKEKLQVLKEEFAKYCQRLDEIYREITE